MKRLLEKVVENAVLITFGGFTAIAILVTFANYGITVYRTVISPTGSAEEGARATVVMIVLFVGLLLGRLRYKWQKAFGVLQLIVAGVAAWSLSGNPVSNKPLVNAVALIGVAFIAARGFYDEGETDWRTVDERWRRRIEDVEKNFADDRLSFEADMARSRREREEAEAKLDGLERRLEALQRRESAEGQNNPEVRNISRD